MVAIQTYNSSWSWVIGGHPIGSSKGMSVLCLTRIGSTHLTRSYILNKVPSPQCEQCQCILTVPSILVECNKFAQESKDIFGIK